MLLSPSKVRNLATVRSPPRSRRKYRALSVVRPVRRPASGFIEQLRRADHGMATRPRVRSPANVRVLSPVKVGNLATVRRPASRPAPRRTCRPCPVPRPACRSVPSDLRRTFGSTSPPIAKGQPVRVRPPCRVAKCQNGGAWARLSFTINMPLTDIQSATFADFIGIFRCPW